MTQTIKDVGRVIAVTAFVLVLLFGIAVATGLMRVPLLDIWREGTQHSQQYVETKRSLLLALITDYEQAASEAGRQTAIANRVCEEATLIPASEWPSTVASFVSQHC